MATPPDLCNPPYPIMERDGYVYVRLNRRAAADIQPFAMPHYGDAGWKHLRLQNRFANNVGNCVENFIDIPHTAFVHSGIFRSHSGESIAATIVREGGAVHVRYRNERGNLGTFHGFLNPRREPVGHTDSFYTPNVTSVPTNWRAAGCSSSRRKQCRSRRTRLAVLSALGHGGMGAG
jgi:phenylpropionate dioxygenase-like ring-hydroxylating dioxygenase large terminal subunit